MLYPQHREQEGLPQIQAGPGIASVLQSWAGLAG